MTDEQINEAIAEVCGWTETSPWINGDRCFEKKDDPCGYRHWDIPNYCNDLNAMHEAEKTLTDDKYHQFTDCLYDLEQHRLNQTNKWRWLSVTANQRAEAFLRTLGKWEEVQK